MYRDVILTNETKVTADLSITAVCRRCKKLIVWAVTKNLKNIPIEKNPDGSYTCHFERCATATKNFDDSLSECQRQEDRERRKIWL